MSRSVRAALPLALCLASCQQLDPATQATSDYLIRLQPLLQENSLLSERVLFQAAAVYNEAAKPDQVAKVWSTEIVPLAEHLHYQSQYVAVPDQWALNHQELSAIWGDRATAYRELSEAIMTADGATWKANAEAVEQVRLREENWFKLLNEAIGRMGMVVDPYP